MFDPFSLAAGAGILAVGYLTGSLGRRKPSKSQAINQAMCGCGHPRALHDQHTNRCGKEVERAHYDNSGYRSGNEWVPCTCQRYDGPKPFEELYPSPILPSAE